MSSFTEQWKHLVKSWNLELHQVTFAAHLTSFHDVMRRIYQIKDTQQYIYVETEDSHRNGVDDYVSWHFITEDKKNELIAQDSKKRMPAHPPVIQGGARAPTQTSRVHPLHVGHCYSLRLFDEHIDVSTLSTYSGTYKAVAHGAIGYNHGQEVFEYWFLKDLEKGVLIEVYPHNRGFASLIVCDGNKQLTFGFVSDYLEPTSTLLPHDGHHCIGVDICPCSNACTNILPYT